MIRKTERFPGRRVLKEHADNHSDMIISDPCELIINPCKFRVKMVQSWREPLSRHDELEKTPMNQQNQNPPRHVPTAEEYEQIMADLKAHEKEAL